VWASGKQLTLQLGPSRTEILEWISSIPYMSHHQRISDGRLENTARWILQRDEYHDWRASSKSMLLLLRGIRMSPRFSLWRFSLTKPSSRGWKNLRSFERHRLPSVPTAVQQARVFLLQSSRGKSPREAERIMFEGQNWRVVTSSHSFCSPAPQRG